MLSCDFHYGLSCSVLICEQCHKQVYISVPKEAIMVSGSSKDDEILLQIKISKEIVLSLSYV